MNRGGRHASNSQQPDTVPSLRRLPKFLNVIFIRAPFTIGDALSIYGFSRSHTV
ncbi:uncharacterized protein METZ01_LOCUS452288 [marine metagenome]|uniref:Uncharacterized protein n=1 Tax=marine metagenome TaxID=408172 RepID=A0A382ZVA8_9ZZZZ